MTSLLIEAGAARTVVIATVVVATVGEAAATYAGQRRMGGPSGVRGVLGSFLESSLARNRGSADADRWTKQLIVGATVLGLIVAWTIAKDDPSLRFGANEWWTLALGSAVALVGIGLRCWSVLALGRFFRRVVAIDRRHELVRTGPYRVLRHPAYREHAARIRVRPRYGRWLGALAFVVIALVGHLPRIRVEESVLEGAFGAKYSEYARTTARLVPGLW